MFIKLKRTNGATLIRKAEDVKWVERDEDATTTGIMFENGAFILVEESVDEIFDKLMEATTYAMAALHTAVHVPQLGVPDDNPSCDGLNNTKDHNSHE